MYNNISRIVFFSHRSTLSLVFIVVAAVVVVVVVVVVVQNITNSLFIKVACIIKELRFKIESTGCWHKRHVFQLGLCSLSHIL